MSKRTVSIKGSYIFIIVCGIIVFFISYFCTTLCYNNYCDNHNYPIQIIAKDYSLKYNIQEVINEDENVIEIKDIYGKNYTFNKKEYIIRYKYNTK